MQKISPFLWFDDNAEEAMNCYTSVFEGSRVVRVSRIGDGGPAAKGAVIVATFELAGQRFMALNGGPKFKFSPAISFFVHGESQGEVEALWKRLSAGGTALMPLDKYPFSPLFGWVQDRFGVSWQVNLGARPQKITPFLMFVGPQHGKAEEAIKLYTSIFKDARVIELERYGAGGAGPAGTLKRGLFTLHGREFMAIDGAGPHAFSFSTATSFMVDCESQAEVDELWDKLSAGGTIEQCGWLKDKFGVSWQIIPTVLTELMSDSDHAKAGRVVQAMLQMKKIDIAGLKRAHAGA